MITLYLASFDYTNEKLNVSIKPWISTKDQLAYHNATNSLIPQGWRTTKEEALNALKRNARQAIEKAEDDIFIGPPLEAQ